MWFVRPHLRALIPEAERQPSQTVRWRRFRSFRPVWRPCCRIGVTGPMGRWGCPFIRAVCWAAGPGPARADARAAIRFGNQPNNRNNNAGFRVVCSSTSFRSFRARRLRASRRVRGPRGGLLCARAFQNRMSWRWSRRSSGVAAACWTTNTAMCGFPATIASTSRKTRSPALSACRRSAAAACGS